MIWQPEFTDKTLSRKPGAVQFNYIECDYNRWRRHSWCGGLSPEQFENQNLA
ncbi:hypothetical protein BSZ13_08040 [Escherichia coli]|nr:hypothetical protein BSZ13_08040 [Escherichia coli]